MRNGKIEIISLAAAICVVWWHSLCGSQIERWFVPSFVIWSVPWFFFVSGLFFWRSLERKGCLLFLRGKIKSLVIPYFVWCSIGVVISVGGGLCEWNIADAYALRIGFTHPTGNHALWYLRSLIYFTIVGAMVFLCVRKCGRFSKVMFGCLFLVLTILLRKYGFAFGPGSSPVYFCAGVVSGEWLLSREDVYTEFKSARLALLGGGAMLLAVIVRVLWFYLGYDARVAEGTVIANISTVLILIGLWLLVGMKAKQLHANNVVSTCCGLTAFVYFMHNPLNDLIKKYLCFSNKDVYFIFLLFALPSIYFAVAVCVKRFVPRCYSLCSGGR